MAITKKFYQAPELIEVNLIPQEAVLEVCKNHESAWMYAKALPHCSWPAGEGFQPCRGVTGS